MAKSKDNPQDKLINLQAQQLAAQVANWAAQLEFQKERMRLLELPEMQGKLQVDIDRLAFDKAQATWENAFKEASITGKYNGQDTIEWLTQQAQLTGVLNGQQTIQGRLTDAQIKQMNDQMKLANDQFLAQTTGYINGQKTFDREKFEASQASDAWKFLATLTGPENAFKQARAIGSMPGGYQGLMQAWAGQYAMPGSTSVGSGGKAGLAGLVQTGEPGGWAPAPYAPPGSGGTGAPPTPPVPGAPPGSPPGTGAPSPGTGYVAPINVGAPAQGAPPVAPTPDPGTPGAPDPMSGIVGHQGTMDPGFYVWLRTHNYDPGGADRDRLPEFIHNYTGLPDKDHTEYMQFAARDPASYQFNQSNWLDTTSLGFAPLPGLPSAPPSNPVGPPGPGSKPIPNIAPVTNDPGMVHIMGGATVRPSYLNPAQYAQFDALPEDTKQQYMAYDQGASSSSTPYAGGAYEFAPAGYQASVEGWNYSPTNAGTMHVYPPGVTSPAGTPDVTTPYPVSPSSAYSMYQYGAAPPSTPAYSNAPVMGQGLATAQTAPPPDPLQAGTSYNGPLLPNQINAKNYNNTYSYMQELGWAGYEDAGWDKGLAQDAFKKSLPTYGGPKTGSYAF